MKNRVLRFFLTLPLISGILALNGCNDIRELDRISIVTGVAIDKSDKPGSIQLTVQIGKISAVGGGPQGGGSSEEEATILMDAVSPSVLGALDILRHDNSRILFLHHNQVLIFGETQAKSGITPYLDTFMRDHEPRMEVQILIAEGDASDVLGVNMDLEKISTMGIRRMVMNKADIAKSQSTNLLNLVSKLTDLTTSPVAPIIKIVKEDDITRLSLSGMAVFKGGKMIGEITEEQAEGFSWLMGDLKSGTTSVKSKQGTVELYIDSVSSKIKPKFDKEGKPSMTAMVEGTFTLGGITGFEGMKLSKAIQLIEKDTKKAVKRQIMDCYNTAQRMGADIYGFGAYIYRHNPKEWKSLKSKWEQVFPSMELSLDIEVKIQETGKIGFSPEMEEVK